MPASILCSVHGGRLPDERRAVAERVELAKMTVLNTLIATVERAAAVYIGIMDDPTEKATDRIKAADRVMEMAGLRNGQPLVQVNVQTGLRPTEDARDARLIGIIERHNAERAAILRERAIESTARETA